jgi:3-oxoacyl-[acyl-carrier protein] reductase
VDLKLKGKKALVTGASRGIGLRIARQFADEGVHVGICARTQADVDKAVAELKAKGVNAVGSAIDIRDRDALVGWIESSAEQLGGLDIYVSNVSAGPTEPGEGGWRNGFESDVLGAIRGCEAAMPYLQKSDAAAIVMIASIYGVLSKAPPNIPGVKAYSACKAALITYGAQLSKEVAKDGIRVNSVSPGPIYFEGGPWDHIKQGAPQVYEDAMKECVIGRLGTPEEIASAVVFLASPISGFTTGQNLHVDGGYMHHINF